MSQHLFRQQGPAEPLVRRVVLRDMARQTLSLILVDRIEITGVQQVSLDKNWKRVVFLTVTK